MRRSGLAVVIVIVVAGGIFGAPTWIALPLVALALTPRLA
jgi:hypothetical protein